MALFLGEGGSKTADWWLSKCGLMALYHRNIHGPKTRFQSPLCSVVERGGCKSDGGLEKEILEVGFNPWFNGRGGVNSDELIGRSIV